jgi:hypothetical protein
MKNLFFEYISPQYHSAQCEVAGLCLRIGKRAWVVGTLDYMEKNPTWPRWLRFRLCLHGPRHMSMSGRPHYAIYLFGCRIVDNAYWEPVR